MELTDRAAYIKGLMEGLGIDDSTKEGKVLLALSELVTDLTNAVVVLDEDLSIAYEQIDDLEELVEELEAELDDMGEELEAVEDLLADFIDDEFDDEDEEEDEDDYEELDEEDDEDDFQYELTCQHCGTVNYVDEETLLSEEIFCGNCKEPFYVEIIAEEDEEETEE